MNIYLFSLVQCKPELLLTKENRITALNKSINQHITFYEVLKVDTAMTQ